MSISGAPGLWREIGIPTGANHGSRGVERVLRKSHKLPGVRSVRGRPTAPAHANSSARRTHGPAGVSYPSSFLERSGSGRGCDLPHLSPLHDVAHREGRSEAAVGGGIETAADVPWNDGVGVLG